MKVPLQLRRPALLPARDAAVALPLPLRALLRLSALLVTAAATIAALALGAWWLTPLSGAVFGLLLGRWRKAAPVAALAAAVAWLAPLLLLAPAAFVERAASVLAGILGVGALGAPGALVLTALVGAILSVSGTWVGVALRSLKEG
jgi:hypothetical protein